MWLFGISNLIQQYMGLLVEPLVLQKIQSLDPPGIAARNLQETLMLQLERKGPEASLARKIVQEHFPLLEKKQWDLIARHLHANLEAIRHAARLIARLDPKPGRTFYAEEPVAITPDANVYFDEETGKLRVEIHDEELPEIRINPYYRKLLKDQKLDPQSRRFLREKIQSALDFLKALSQRRSTLRGITEEIVQAQSEFFEKGFSHLECGQIDAGIRGGGTCAGAASSPPESAVPGKMGPPAPGSGEGAPRTRV